MLHHKMLLLGSSARDVAARWRRRQRDDRRVGGFIPRGLGGAFAAFCIVPYLSACPPPDSTAQFAPAPRRTPTTPPRSPPTPSSCATSVTTRRSRQRCSSRPQSWRRWIWMCSRRGLTSPCSTNEVSDKLKHTRRRATPALAPAALPRNTHSSSLAHAYLRRWAACGCFAYRAHAHMYHQRTLRYRASRAAPLAPSICVG